MSEKTNWWKFVKEELWEQWNKCKNCFTILNYFLSYWIIRVSNVLHLNWIGSLGISDHIPLFWWAERLDTKNSGFSSPRRTGKWYFDSPLYKQSFIIILLCKSAVENVKGKGNKIRHHKVCHMIKFLVH